MRHDISPRGAVVCPARPIVVGGITVGGRKAGLILYVHTHSEARRQLKRLAKRFGVDVRPVQTMGAEGSTTGEGETIDRTNENASAYPDAVECIGSVDGVYDLRDTLKAQGYLIRSHLILNVAVPRGAAGAASKDSLSPAQAREVRTPKAQRFLNADPRYAADEGPTA